MLIETEYRAQAPASQEVIQGVIPLVQNGAVVAIGNFDGVHRGHQTVLENAKKAANAKGIPLVVLTFGPHPRLFFKPDQPEFLLTDEVQKYIFLMACGVGLVVSLRFDAALAGLSAEGFMDDVLLGMLNAKAVVVGDNFQFGKGRSGDVAMLKSRGFDVLATPQLANDGERISSERIRAALRDGNIELANTLLGRPWQLRGTVVQGHQRGRTIGFPTANIDLGRYLHPAFGVYAAKATVDGQTVNAVVNIGKRPTIGISGPLVEAHLLDFSGDLYGKTLTLDLLAFLRAEQKFDDFEALKVQIAKDVEQTRAIL